MKFFLQAIVYSIFTVFIIKAQSNLWTDISENEFVTIGEQYIIPDTYRILQLNLKEVNAILKSAPMEFTSQVSEGNSIIELPMPNGEFQKFRFWESPAIGSELQDQYPEIRTYMGQGIDYPYATLNFDLTSQGFQAQILSPNGSVFIGPHNKGDIYHYISYYSKDFTKKDATLEYELFSKVGKLDGQKYLRENTVLTPNDPQLLTYNPCPIFEISPDSLNFGTVNIGNHAALPATVSNPGGLELDISNITSSNAQFTFTPNTFPVHIEPEGSQVFNVTFTPTAAGVVNGNLEFTHNAEGSSSILPLQGEGRTQGGLLKFVQQTRVLYDGTTNNQDAIVLSGYTGQPLKALQFDLILGKTNEKLILNSVNRGDGIPDPNFSFDYQVYPGPIQPDGSHRDTIKVVILGNTNNVILPGSPDVEIMKFSYDVVSITGTSTTTSNGLENVFGATAPPVVDANITAGSDELLTIYNGTGGLLKFVQQTRDLYDGTTNNQDAIVLSGYTGQPLKALQFDLILGKANQKLILNSVSRGDGIPDPNFSFDYQVYPGPIQPDGSHTDRIKVVILGNTNNVILPGGPDVEIMKFSYDVVSIVGNSTTTSNGLENVFGATATPVVDANITAGPDEILTIYNGTIWGLLGDVNLDNQVDLLDILLMIDHILGRVTLTGQAWTNGDIAPWDIGAPLPTPDGVINVLDLAVLQNIVLTGLYPNGNSVNRTTGIPFVISNQPKLTPGMDAKLTFYLSKNGITVGLESAKKVKGVQIEMNGVNSIIPTNTSMTSVFDTKVYYQLNDFLRTLTYDGQSLPMNPGEYLLAKIPFSFDNPEDIEISKIIVADENNSAMEKVEIEIKYDEIPIPLNYSLSQNFPNPFNPTTSVQFSIPVDGFVTIKVYDLLGQAVADLYSGSTLAGTYTLNWDGKDNSGKTISSGSYIYRMTAGEFVQSKKMTYLK